MIRIAVITHKVVQLENDAISLELSFSSDEQSEYNFSSSSKATVVSNADIDKLNEYAGEEDRITLFYLDKDAAYAMKLSQNRIKSAKENNISGDTYFGINLRTDCLNGPAPTELLANVYAQFSSQKSYVKMLSNIDLLDQFGIDQEEQVWAECPASAQLQTNDLMTHRES